MTAAIAKLFDGVPEKGGVFRGTAFAVSREVGLTAFHCVGNRESGEVLVKRVVLLFRGDMRDIKIEAEVEKGDHRADFALLRFLGSLPDVLQPIPLTRGVAPHAPFRCAGYPRAPISFTVMARWSLRRPQSLAALMHYSCTLTSQPPSFRCTG